MAFKINLTNKNRQMSSVSRGLPDIAGFLGGTICLVHCIGGPLFLVLGWSFFTSEWLKYPFMATSFWAVYGSCSCHTSLRADLFMWGAFFGMFFSSLFMESFQWLHIPFYASSIALVIGHTWKFITRKKNIHVA